MQNFKNLLYFLLSFFVAGFVWSIVLLFLPNVATFYTPIQHKTEFFRINLSIFNSSQPKVAPQKVITTSSSSIIKLFKLKAIYNNKNGGFIIIEDRGSHFLDLGDNYRGYKLTKIYPTYVEFTKNNKIYTLAFKNSNLPKVSPPSKALPTPTNFKISKKTMLEYKNNLSKIWNNIGIIKVSEGYKITYIKKGSIFDKIGLKKGDILIKVNSKELIDDNDAWQLYKNSSKYDSFEIEIKRKNQIKVLNYEVY
jgi:general secretion pathway protein C